VWRRVRQLEARRPSIEWTGPLPIVCPQDWPSDELLAWEAARAAGDETMMDVLIERHAGVRPLPPEAGIPCNVVDHRPPHGERTWDG